MWPRWLHCPGAQAFTNKTFTDKVLSYNGVATVGNGLSATYAQDDRVNQSATIATTTLVTGTASTGGHWRLSGFIGTTATDASGATYQLRISATSAGITRVIGVLPLTGSLNVGTTSSFATGDFPVNIDASTNITYTVIVTGTPTTGRFESHVWASKE